MIFRPTPLAGAMVIDLEVREDERGFFARTFCADEFRRHGLNPVFCQCNLSFNRRRGTLRGLHYQAAPSEETKLVSCPQGEIFDVIVDLRRDSATYLRHFAVELSSRNRRSLYIPSGVAHGFQTLADSSEVSYLMGAPHCPSLARGVRYDDPALQIRWPMAPTCLSKNDSAWPLLQAAARFSS